MIRQGERKSYFRKRVFFENRHDQLGLSVMGEDFIIKIITSINIDSYQDDCHIMF